MKLPEIYFRNNTAATLSLLEAMLATGHDRIVFSSTGGLLWGAGYNSDTGGMRS